MSEICEDEFRAMWRDWLKNSSVARQVRVESERRMKRYTLPELLSGAKNGTVTLDGEYVLYSDLIAAGCLVPVPVGEACKISEMECLSIEDCTNTCTVEGLDWRIYAAERRVDDSGHRYLMPITDKWPPIAFSGDTIVQPVRLVPLAELEADHG